MSAPAEVNSSEMMSAYGAALAECVPGPREEFGERLIRKFLSSWENPELRPKLIGIFRAAFTSDEGAAVLQAFMSNQLFERIADSLKVSPLDLDGASGILNVPPLNLNAAASQVWGVVMLRYILEIEPIASAPQEDIVQLLAPTIQRYLGAELQLPSEAGTA